jgi:hypothetical protein
MIHRLPSIARIAVASAFASALLSTAAAVSAQTAIAPAAPSATTVTMATVNVKADRQKALEQESADARRVEFRNLGTSL